MNALVESRSNEGAAFREGAAAKHAVADGVQSASPFWNLIETAPPKPSVQGNVVGPVLHGGPPRIILVHEQSGRRSRDQLRHHWLRAQVVDQPFAAHL